MTELCERHGEAHTVLYPGIDGTERCALCALVARVAELGQLLRDARAPRAPELALRTNGKDTMTPDDHERLAELVPDYALPRVAGFIDTLISARIVQERARHTKQAQAVQYGRDAGNLLVWLWDHGHIIAAHDPNCPEDDTCECHVAQLIEATIARVLKQ